MPPTRGLTIPWLRWNDYEEGTEIETGIDNCMSLSASLSGNTLQWMVSGYEDTLDHYRVFISTDGQHLMPLTTMAVGSRSLNLCSYTLAQRSYVLFVQAIGRPTIRNRLSRAIAYTPHCSAVTASVNLGAFPATLRVSAGKSPGRDVGTLQDHVNPVEGRRAQLMGDKAKARTDYQDFFILRKDADPDIPNPA